MSQQKIFKIGIYSLYAAAIIPLIFFQGFFYPFVVNKVLFFRLMVQIALSCYTLLLISDFQRFKPKINTAMKLSFIFLGITIISAIFGLDFYRSFISDFERLEGVTGVIYLTIYLFLLWQFLQTKKDWLNYIKFAVVVSFLVSLYGIIQRFSLLPVFEAGDSRVSGTVGNPAFLAGYLLLAGGLATYWYLTEKNKHYKIFAGLTAILDIFVLLLTATRGAILGLIFGAVVFLLIYGFWGHKKLKKYSIIFLLIIVLSAVAFFNWRENFKNSPVEFVNRIANISMRDDSIKNRLLVWQWGWESFKENPILGVGVENFNYEYNKYFTPKVSEDWFDRTHNIYLDQLVQNGILGFLAYLIIFAYLFYRLWSARKENKTAFIIFLPLLAAYAVHNAFVFDTINTAFLYFFIIAFICQTKQEELNLSVDAISFFNQRRKIMLYVIIAVNVFVLYFLVYLPFIINRNIYVGYHYIVADTERSLNSFEKVLGYKLGSVEAASQLYQLYSILLSQSDALATDKQRYLMLTRDKLMESIEDFPLEIRNKRYMAELLTSQPRSLEELYLAEEILLSAKRLSPGRPEIYYLLYNLYSKKEDKLQGFKELEELIEHLPWFGEAKITYANLIKKNDPERAEELFNEGMNQYYSGAKENHKIIIEYLLYTERYAEAIPFFQKLIKSEPDIYSHHLDLSRLLFLTENIDEALSEVQFLEEYHPEELSGQEEYIIALREAAAKRD